MSTGKYPHFKRHREEKIKEKKKVQSEEEGPVCNCKPPRAAKEGITQKEGPNQGRPYFACPINKKEGGCGWFCWADTGESNDPKPAAKKPKTEPSNNDLRAREVALTALAKSIEAVHRTDEKCLGVLQEIREMADDIRNSVNLLMSKYCDDGGPVEEPANEDTE